MLKITTVTIVLVTFHSARGEKTASWKFMVGAKKNSASELKVGKNLFS
jgi:hypothetical protein